MVSTDARLRRRTILIHLFAIACLYTLCASIRFLVGETVIYPDAAHRAYLGWRWFALPTLLPHCGDWLPGHFYALGALCCLDENPWYAMVAGTLVVGLLATYGVYFLSVRLVPGRLSCAFATAVLFVTHHWIISMCVTPLSDVWYYLSVTIGLAGVVGWWSSRSKSSLWLGLLSLGLGTTFRFEPWILGFLTCGLLYFDILSGGMKRIRQSLGVLLAAPVLLGGFPLVWLVKDSLQAGFSSGNVNTQIRTIRQNYSEASFWQSFWTQPSQLVHSSGLLLLVALLGAFFLFKVEKTDRRRVHFLFLILVGSFFVVFNSLRYFGITSAAVQRMLLIHLICLLPYASFLLTSALGRPPVPRFLPRVPAALRYSVAGLLLAGFLYQSHSAFLPGKELKIDESPLQLARILRAAFDSKVITGIIRCESEPNSSQVTVWIVSGQPQRFFSTKTGKLGDVLPAEPGEDSKCDWEMTRPEGYPQPWNLAYVGPATGQTMGRLDNDRVVVECPQSRLAFFVRELLANSSTDFHAECLLRSVADASKDLFLPVETEARHQFADSVRLLKTVAELKSNIQGENQAEEVFLQALEDHPDDPETCFEYALFLGKTNRFEESLKWFLKSAPGYPREKRAYAWCEAANVALLLGKQEVAEDCIEKSIAWDPGYYWSYEIRAGLNQLRKKDRAALLDMRQAEELKRAARK